MSNVTDIRIKHTHANTHAHTVKVGLNMKKAGWRTERKSEVWSEWLPDSDKNKVTNREGPKMKDVNKLKVDSWDEAEKWSAQPADSQDTSRSFAL